DFRDDDGTAVTCCDCDCQGLGGIGWCGCGSDLDGGTVSLADFLGRPLLLIFGSQNCVPCRNLVPDLNIFAHERASELRVLFLSRSEPDAARAFAGETGIQVPIATHPDAELPEAYKARVTPFGFLIDGEGVVRAKSLTNNRDHLEMLVRMAGGKALRPVDAPGTNGPSAGRTADERTRLEEQA
ncbi:MAG: TlpA disulfide reductase family protein, partial [Dehalococcoidia bacterium]|nr:TlpA disulfide reductase family protein [Dehalococcoidia bacterium]